MQTCSQSLLINKKRSLTCHSLYRKAYDWRNKWLHQIKDNLREFFAQAKTKTAVTPADISAKNLPHVV